MQVAYNTLATAVEAQHMVYMGC